ncbi:MAG: DUF2752 domain-containing protein [bacterium]|nr:DUF2752 domain-containing protein [bacterium]
MTERIKRVVKRSSSLLVLGILYGVWLIKTDIGIPCPIRTITGLRCPGCGISHMCMALIQGNFTEAYHANRILFCLLPVFIVEGIHLILRYIKQGNKPLSKWDNWLMYCLIVIIVIWGIVRNIPAFSYLN